MAAHDNHGQSVAAWTTVGILIVASLVLAIAVVLGNVALGVVGAVLVVAGLVAGRVLGLAGYGSKQPGPRRPLGLD